MRAIETRLCRARAHVIAICAIADDFQEVVQARNARLPMGVGTLARYTQKYERFSAGWLDVRSINRAEEARLSPRRRRASGKTSS
jgi:hypothetical protein